MSSFEIRSSVAVVVFVVVFLAGCTTPPVAQPGSDVIHATFACDSGKSVDAAFSNGTASRVDLKLSDGRALSLPQTRSGSGARYASPDDHVVFWNRGDTAFLEESGAMTYRGCVAQASVQGAR